MSAYKSINIQTLVRWSVASAGLAVAVVLGSTIAKGDYRSTALMITLGFGFVLYFRFSAFLWMICAAAIFIPGTLTFLPLGLKPFELLLIVGTSHFFLEKTVLKKLYPSMGPQPAGSWLLLCLAIVFFHSISDRFGVRLLGSDMWGGRGYLGILTSGVAYYCLQSMRINISSWSKLPILVMLVSSVDLVVKLVSFNFPAFELAVSSFYSGTLSYDPFLEFSRWGFLGDFGYVLVTAALSYSTLPGMISRGKIVPPILLLAGVVLCLSSGYRSSLLFLVCLLLVGSARDLRFKTLFIFPILITGLLFISWINSSVYTLPQGIQRGLVWIPGTWDENLKIDAAGSDDFRWKVWAYWAQNKFPEAPFFGRGLAVPYQEILENIEAVAAIDSETGNTISTYADRELSFTVTGNLHNGFLSVVDRFGIIGSFCFFAFIATSFINIIKVTHSTPIKYRTLSIHWFGIYICAYILAYPIGALRIDDFFAPTVFMIGVFNALVADYRRSQAKDVSNPGADAVISRGSNVPSAVAV